MYYRLLWLPLLPSIGSRRLIGYILSPVRACSRTDMCGHFRAAL